jgi:hypothetical protein
VVYSAKRCKGCGVTLPPAHKKSRLYCSLGCQNRARSREREKKNTHVCSGCGQTIENRKSGSLLARKRWRCVICEALQSAEKNGRALPAWWIDRVTGT